MKKTYIYIYIYGSNVLRSCCHQIIQHINCTFSKYKIRFRFSTVCNCHLLEPAGQHTFSNKKNYHILYMCLLQLTFFIINFYPFFLD